ncbi:MAG: potassium transporter Trk, partial [Synergistaceae bacterium]|nr:potassium transporter Trk [Synergistaceae bacterium]
MENKNFNLNYAVLLGFLSLITAGSLLLWALGNFYYNLNLSLLDALFTSVSAVCTTGLTVIDFAQVPYVMQIVLTVLIQCGGLGIMSLITFIITRDYRDIIKVCIISVLIELIGIIPLYWAFAKSFEPIRAFRYAAFHSVSAFCNAGFSLFSYNLTPYVRGLAVSGVIMLLVILGGLGFIILRDIWNFIFKREKIPGRSLLAIQVTFWLIIVGTFLIYLSERAHSLRDLPL